MNNQKPTWKKRVEECYRQSITVGDLATLILLMVVAISTVILVKKIITG